MSHMTLTIPLSRMVFHRQGGMAVLNLQTNLKSLGALVMKL